MSNLRKDAERVVRPIRASPTRKNQMREELLAHIEGLLADEKARRGDDVDAVRRARRDLASPANSPPSFRPRSPAGSDGHLRRCPGWKEAAAARGRRWAAYQRRWNVRMTYLVLVWCGFAVGCALVGPRPIEVTGIFLVPVLVCTLPLGLEILAEAIRRSLMRLESADPAARRTAWRAVAFEALAAALLTGSTIAGAMLLIERSAHVPVYSPRIFWGITLVLRAPSRCRHWPAGPIKDCPVSPVRPVGRPRSFARCVIPHASTAQMDTRSMCRSGLAPSSADRSVDWFAATDERPAVGGPVFANGGPVVKNNRARCRLRDSSQGDHDRARVRLARLPAAETIGGAVIGKLYVAHASHGRAAIVMHVLPFPGHALRRGHRDQNR